MRLTPLLTAGFLLVLSSCGGSDFGTIDSLPNQVGVSAAENFGGEDIDFIMQHDPDIIKTTKGARELDLETPLRCRVSWNKQELIAAVPYNMTAFNLVRNGVNDILPRYEVNGFSFKSMPAEKALLKLDKEAGIHLIARDAPYASISGENLRGEFSEVVKMITDAAEIFYSYDADRKVMRISRRANFTLYVPHSRPIMLGLLDVIRGSGITDISADWGDYSITFTSDYETKNKIVDLIDYFKDNPTLIAYDVSVFRIYPTNINQDINWQSILDEFDFSTVNTAQAGVIGRVLTSSNDLNIGSLRRFLGNQATIVPVSEGRFVVPNLWFSRFDVGKCGSKQAIEADLSITAKASLEKNNWIFSHFSLDTTNGEISQFDVRSKLGENFMIIGLPNEIFGSKQPKSETIVFVVPRIIRTAKTTQHIQNQL
ncbi:MAG: hypothetical protein Q4F75_01005 [Pseudomonadota bacterium]|nr:hypothetical protein [Pseudomonadota bacterium]